MSNKTVGYKMYYHYVRGIENNESYEGTFYVINKNLAPELVNNWNMQVSSGGEYVYFFEPGDIALNNASNLEEVPKGEFFHSGIEYGEMI